ncbi:putative membrane protein YdjX (TVP38/TMEM64 family) [Neolewinella xylanilytica]|uniref:TVP38/TMEM64 family membrane protein n=1 Tax=Neolewinella xylanilytica TaxID=1514080 RepID=A0A2S6I9E7_9BACT|nr:VTT domain-containing protein [Neolewinella xylanilytica]PPK88108.1 putative membrane protein YdjX (TVP38/TMEM64 family) [Neolewinella xylanilytica]
MSKEKTSKLQIIIYSVSALVLVGSVASYFIFPGFQSGVQEAYDVVSSGNNQRITEYVMQFGFWGPLVVILIMTVQMFLIVVPSWLLMIIAVLAYGPWWGGLLSVVAVTVASTIGYSIGMGLSEASLSKLVGNKSQAKLSETVTKYGSGAVVLFRLAPFLSNDAISFVAGMLKMGYVRFILATLAGIIPLTVLIAFFSQDIEQLKNILVWVGGIGLGLYLIYLAYQYFTNKRD